MLSFLKNLFGHRPTRYERFRSGAGSMVRGRRGGIALGTLATFAAPFIIRRVRSRMAARQATR